MVPFCVWPLLHSLGGDHALIDGNKRLARLATVVVPDVSGPIVELDGDAAFDLVMEVGAERLEPHRSRLAPRRVPTVRAVRR